MTFHQLKRRVRCIQQARSNDLAVQPSIEAWLNTLYDVLDRQDRLEKMAARLFERSRARRNGV